VQTSGMAKLIEHDLSEYSFQGSEKQKEVIPDLAEHT
jgi:hypothetical protein